MQFRTFVRNALVLYVLAVVLALVGCGSSGPSQAEEWSKNVHVTLDVTTADQVLAQMPTDKTFEASKNASNQRVETWTFDDGSQLIFAYEPIGGEGSGQGLVLKWVDTKE